MSHCMKRADVVICADTGDSILEVLRRNFNKDPCVVKALGYINALEGRVVILRNMLIELALYGHQHMAYRDIDNGLDVLLRRADNILEYDNNMPLSSGSEAEYMADQLADNLKWLRSISFSEGDNGEPIWPNGETREQIDGSLNVYRAWKERLHGKAD